jgi:hypothetical protein
MHVLANRKAMGVMIFWGLVGGFAAAYQWTVLGEDFGEMNRCLFCDWPKLILFAIIAFLPAAITAMVAYSVILANYLNMQSSISRWMLGWCLTGVLVAFCTFFAAWIVFELTIFINGFVVNSPPPTSYYFMNNLVSAWSELMTVTMFSLVIGSGVAVAEGLMIAILTLPLAYFALRRYEHLWQLNHWDNVLS